MYSLFCRLTPQLSFSWSEVKELKFKGKKFIVKFVNKQNPNFVFHTMNVKTSKQIFSLGHGNKMLHKKRRLVESPEVTVLREKATALKALKQKNK